MERGSGGGAWLVRGCICYGLMGRCRKLDGISSRDAREISCLELVWQKKKRGRKAKRPFRFVTILPVETVGVFGIFGTEGERSFVWDSGTERSYPNGLLGELGEEWGRIGGGRLVVEDW